MKADPETSRTGAPDRTLAYAAHGALYLNVTSRCTLRCRFCPKFRGQWVVDGCNLRLRKEPEASELIAAVGDPDPARYREVVFCGLGEPTLRLPVVLEVARTLKAHNARVRLNTDGLANLVHGRDVTPEFAGVIDAVAISLNAQDAAVYDWYCRPSIAGSYEAVREFIDRVRPHVPEVSVSAVDGLAGVDIMQCEQIARRHGARFRRRVLDEVG